MKKKTQKIVATLALTLTFAFGLTTVYGQYKGREAVELIAVNFQAAWNRHDMKALSELFAEDVDFITVAGTWQKGRKDFEEKHAKSHNLQFKESVLTIDKTEARFLRPDIAVAHVEWSMRGDKDVDGTARQPRQGIFTWVLGKQKGKWLIIASQNTNIKSHMPGK